MHPRKAALLGAVVVLFTGSELAAQSRPSFAGTWAVVPDASVPAEAMGMAALGLGDRAVVEQTADGLTVTRSTQYGEFTTAYTFDGTATPSTFEVDGNSIRMSSRARWEGARLVLETTVYAGANQIDSSSSLTLEPSGDVLVETTGTGMGASPMSVRLRYRKG